MEKLQCATSLLYQLASWVFLRIIPAKAGTKVLPTLYLAYVGLWATSELARIKSQRRAASGSRRNGGAKVSVVAEGETLSGEAIKLGSAAHNSGARAHSSPARLNGEASKGSPKRSPTKPGRSLLRALVSLPTHSAALNLVPLLVNTVLFCWTMDLLYTPSYFFPSDDLAFVRVGAVGHDMAKLTIRVPSVNATSDPVRVSYRPRSYGSSSPPAAEVVPAALSEPFVTTVEDDFLTTVTLEHLLPGLTYQYWVPAIATHGTFTTAPDPALVRTTGSHFTFLSTSCIKPNYPYSPPLKPSHFSQQSRLAIPGFEQLAVWLSDLGKKPAFMLELGDFIYADTPVGFKTEDWFRRLYRQVYANQHVRAVLAELPILAIWDDHELKNDWFGEGHPETQPGFAQASGAYSLFLGAGNWGGGEDNKRWYDFDYGDTSFFVLDTRPERSDERMPDGPDKTMLGPRQKAELIEWLHKVNQTATFKFIATSVPFTSLWGPPDGHLDTFAGYLHERDELMAVIDRVPNVIFLSGDRHEFAAVQLRGKAYEFSTSPLSQFYVPYTWTLKPERTRYLPGLTKTPAADGGSEPEEVLLKYLPDGNVKWGSLEVNTLDPEQPRVNFLLWIDSKVAWSFEIIGESIHRPRGQQLGARALGGIKSMLEDLGFQPSKWL